MNAFLDNDICEDELNHGDCMFDGFDCCGYDRDNDGDYDDNDDIAPGETALCVECLCKGMYKKLCNSLEKTKLSREFAVQFDRLDENQMKLMKLQYNQVKIGLQ